MRQQQTEAIILSTMEVFDADRSYLLLTKELGKVRARAKGVRKIGSKLAGHLLAYLPTQVELVETGEWYLIITAHRVGGEATANPYPAESLRFLEAASVLAEGLDKLMPEKVAQPAIYTDSVYSLERLLHLPELGVDRLILAEFFLKALAHLGYLPELKQSVSTGEKLKPDQLYWNSQLGGAFNLTSGVMAEPGSLKLVSSKVIVALRELLKAEFVAERLQVDKDVQTQVVEVIWDYLQTQIGKPLQALKRR